MKAYLINPYTRTIEQVDEPLNDDYSLFYKLLSEPDVHPVSLFCVTQISDAGDVLYLDDEGLLYPDRATWGFDNSDRRYAGRGVICGSDDWGNTTAPSDYITMAFLQAHVRWDTRVSTGDFGPTTESIEDHPILGRVPTITHGEPILKEPQ